MRLPLLKGLRLGLSCLMIATIAPIEIKAEEQAPELFHEFHDAHTESKGLLIITHGVRDHSGSYLEVIEFFNKSGVDVLRYDLRGHGLSKGERGHVDSFETFVADLKRMVELAREERPDRPVFIFGQSMGGLITYRYLLNQQNTELIDGAILSAPAINLPELSKGEKFKLFFAPVARKLNPTSRIEQPIDYNQLSDVDISDRLENDENILSFITISLAHEIVKASKSIHKENELPGDETPIMLIQGTLDTVVNAQANLQFAEKITTEENIHSLEGVLHDPHHHSAPIRDDYFQRLLSFILEAN